MQKLPPCKYKLFSFSKYLLCSQLSGQTDTCFNITVRPALCLELSWSYCAVFARPVLQCSGLEAVDLAWGKQCLLYAKYPLILWQTYPRHVIICSGGLELSYIHALQQGLIVRQFFSYVHPEGHSPSFLIYFCFSLVNKMCLTFKSLLNVWWNLLDLNFKNKTAYIHLDYIPSVLLRKYSLTFSLATLSIKIKYL